MGDDDFLGDLFRQVLMKREKLGLIALAIPAIVVVGFTVRSFGGISHRAPVSLERRRADDLPESLACVEFNRAIEDQHAGVITDSQFDQRMQRVFNAARLSNTPLAREIFTDFQRARLHGGRDEYTKAAAWMMALYHTAGN
jgi:hypothetical protein